jgi:hypothetical protein
MTREHGCKTAFSSHFARQAPESAVDEHGEPGLAGRVAIRGAGGNGPAVRPGVDDGVNHVEAEQGLVAMTDEERLALLRRTAPGDGVDTGAERQGELARGRANLDRVAAVFHRQLPDGFIVGTMHHDDTREQTGGAGAVQFEEDVSQKLAVMPLGEELRAAETFASAGGGNESEDAHDG